ncbi:D-alanyl-D-alanine carboxypeptidase/D-alanyl-D-alanine-endopeptidase [Planotetraspora sp. A-T 1434]|uniref:D-alanyl-D-alanine carboxypeptidase/D-alanyl-D-alanine endopeptidase n=1 Tax=Planotetraspora sp. A-T 1434 TaxID=2979219 RepID=UPI0021C2439F|nr:D-alanyl-D-alanine carboxypeptidase/D-alanyl-D-alanine-endopeptidase [Planotetraspora sp. A-T 1434]MCT9929772.1 D-alanyl-D-alanine carboxypeptidase/D-alanyl-D-alanine-endopeptidase [Planotetraspora sp. A-T 1434]
MVRRERWVVVATLALLQIFVVVAGLYWITHDVAQMPIPIASPEPAPTPLITAGPVLAAAGDGALPAKGTLTAQLGGPMGDPALGKSVAGVVLDARTGGVLFDGRASTALKPASTTKVVTAVAVLGSAGPDARLATTVVQGATPGSIILVGGGDPTLAGPKTAEDAKWSKNAVYPRPASLTQLALRTARSLKAAKITSVDLSYDASLFGGPVTGPGWKPTYIPEGSVAPVAALTMDEGRAADGARFSDPPRATAEAFVPLLRKYGIKVGEDVKPGNAPAGARELARVESPPVYALVERMLTLSDNDLAEALARQVAIKEGLPHTFEGEAKAVHRVLTRLGVDQGVEVYDGSGLSTRNRITPTALAGLLAAASSPSNPSLHSLISGLPVAGFTGTLHNRYGRADSEAGAGVIRAKTGTLTGVNTLAGIVYTADGRLLTFAFMADDVANPPGAIAVLDKMAAIVARS